MSLSRRKAKELIEKAAGGLEHEPLIGEEKLADLCEKIYMIESTYSTSAQQVKADIKDKIVKAIDSAT